LINGSQHTIAPALNIRDLDIGIIAIHIVQQLVGHSGGIGAVIQAGQNLGEVTLGDLGTQVVQWLHPLQVVAEALHIVAGQDLVVHVVEELATTILVDHLSRSGGGVDQVPVPMVAVHSNILSEICQALLILAI